MAEKFHMLLTSAALFLSQLWMGRWLSHTADLDMMMKKFTCAGEYNPCCSVIANQFTGLSVATNAWLAAAG
jgi:hypothetical protein